MIRNLALLSALVCMTPILASGEETAPAESGMTSIFNGKDLTGWDGDPRLWSVKDGVIHGETTDENRAKGNTFLIWQGGRTKDFDLRLSFRLIAANNSGIQYRSKHVTEGTPKNNWVVIGYQHELRNENQLPLVPGFIYDEGGQRDKICLVGDQTKWDGEGKHVIKSDLIDQQQFEKLFKLSDWNDVIILAEGHHLRHYLNNKMIVDCEDDDPKRALTEGVLALQLHAGTPFWVEFKNIRIREIK